MKKILFLLLTLFLNAQSAFACAVCFGNPDSDQARGAMMGVYILLGVITFVLCGIGNFMVQCHRRAKGMPVIGDQAQY